MSFRKFRADFLFTGSTMLDDQNVLITDEIGTVQEIIPFSDTIDDIGNHKGILSPGFINTHCHLELSHLLGKIPEKTGLPDFAYKIITERHYPDEEIIHAAKASIEMMRNNGIVAVGDICNTGLTIGLKKEKLLQFYNFIEVTGWQPASAGDRFQRSKVLYDYYLSSQMNASIVPHAPYSVSSPLWENIAPFFVGKTVTIHNQETPDEDDFFLKGTGQLNMIYEKLKLDNSFYRPPGSTSLQSYFHKLSAAASAILVHNTFIKQVDIRYMKKKKAVDQLVSFCLCPNANLYIENALPPVKLLVDNDLNIVLGTDSLASNHCLDILEEIKTLANGFPFISTETLLGWATLSGAKALQMEARLGSFEKDKQPGIILIDNVSGDKLTTHSKPKRIL